MKNKKILYFLTSAGILIMVIIFLIYRNLFGISIMPHKSNHIILIPTGSSYDQVLDTLESNLTIKNMNLLRWVAEKKNYPDLIKPGRYIINKGLSYTGLINLLRSGKQSPVKITFNNLRTLNQISGKIGKQIEADSSQIIRFFSDESNFRADGREKGKEMPVFMISRHWF